MATFLAKQDVELSTRSAHILILVHFGRIDTREFADLCGARIWMRYVPYGIGPMRTAQEARKSADAIDHLTGS